MDSLEFKATGSLAAIFSFRLLGMFMVLPVLAIYAADLPFATPSLIGFALGIYGVTQAILQIPFGIWSDKLGRRPIIYLGLILFAFGAIIAANATSIWGIIIGRGIQGAGAISAAVMAQLSDLTSEQNRTKAMALIGASIGVSFGLSLILGPIIAKWFGLSGIFWLTSFLAIIGILILAFIVPKNSPITHLDNDINPLSFWQLLRNTELLRLNLGIFVLHAILMATFIIIPLILVNDIGIANEHHWHIYLIALITGFIGMLPLMLYGEKKRRLRLSFISAVTILLLCEIFLYFNHYNLLHIVIGMVLFFTAFNLLEATLPSLISKISPAGCKGSAMGIYATCQFFGTACGAMIGGLLLQHYGINSVIIFCAILALVWLIFAANMNEPPYVVSTKIDLTNFNNKQNDVVLAKILRINGVFDAIITEDNLALYVKYDSKITKLATIKHVI